MTKKIILTCTFILCIIFATTYSFATDELKNTANVIRDGVGTVENGIENVAKDVSGAIKEGTNNVENAGQNITNDIMNEENKMNNNSATTENNDNMDNEYTATKTATDAMGGFFGSSTMWTWLILAVIAAVIIGLVWYYAMKTNNNSHDNY